MPLVTVTTRPGKSKAFKTAILSAVHNALVAAGFMEDAREMVGRVYSILERVTEK